MLGSKFNILHINVGNLIFFTLSTVYTHFLNLDQTGMKTKKTTCRDKIHPGHNETDASAINLKHIYMANPSNYTLQLGRFISLFNF